MSKHLSVFEVLAYVAPAIIMLLFTSVYDIVDGLFVSNFAGVTAFAALNIVMPYLLIHGTVGFMVGAGANAVSREVGQTCGIVISLHWCSLSLKSQPCAGIISIAKTPHCGAYCLRIHYKTKSISVVVSYNVCCKKQEKILTL